MFGLMLTMLLVKPIFWLGQPTCAEVLDAHELVGNAKWRQKREDHGIGNRRTGTKDARLSEVNFVIDLIMTKFW
jgi:hypothetical protein